jgi:hypothetical protein
MFIVPIIAIEPGLASKDRRFVLRVGTSYFAQSSTFSPGTRSKSAKFRDRW